MDRDSWSSFISGSPDMTEEDYNSNLALSLTKSLSSPKKCNFCQKVMFFKAYRCKHCRYRCHKKCHNNCRRNGNPKNYAGEEHWTKVLQANEVNSNLVVLPCGARHSLHHHICCEHALAAAQGGDKSPGGGSGKQGGAAAKDSNIFTTLYSRFCDWVAQTRKDSGPLLGRKSPAPPGVPGSDSGLGTGAGIGRRSRSGSEHSVRTNPDVSGLPLPASPDELPRGYHTSVSSEDSEQGSFYLTSYSSTCSNLTLTSASTATSGGGGGGGGGGLGCLSGPLHLVDPWLASASTAAAVAAGSAAYFRISSHHQHHCHCRYHHGDVSPASPVDSLSGDPFYCNLVHSVPSPTSYTSDTDDGLDCREPWVHSTGHSPGHSPGFSPGRSLSLRRCRPRQARTKHPSISVWMDDRPDARDGENFLTDTWPPSTRRRLELEHSGEANDLDLDESVFEAAGEDSNLRPDIRDALGECSIPYSDLQFGECVRDGRGHHIYRGRWHGDVMVHTYRDLSDTEVADFWGEVSKLSMIRHENVALFMGACLEPPNFAVITGVLKGTSLYEQLHLKSEKLSLHSRVNIVRQVAQGMGYLHARGIVLRKLNSKNVSLEPKVKICLMDYSMAEKKYDRAEFGCIPRGNLCYIAPEMMRSLRVVPPSLEPMAQYTKATDVYAFGTLLYEVLAGQFPFSRTHPEILIWQVGRGKRQSLKHLNCVSILKVFIKKSWVTAPESRISFAEINEQLQKNAALHKKHSSSHPENLNRVGLVSRGSSLFP